MVGRVLTAAVLVAAVLSGCMQDGAPPALSESATSSVEPAPTTPAAPAEPAKPAGITAYQFATTAPFAAGAYELVLQGLTPEHRCDVVFGIAGIPGEEPSVMAVNVVRKDGVLQGWGVLDFSRSWTTQYGPVSSDAYYDTIGPANDAVFGESESGYSSIYRWPPERFVDAGLFGDVSFMLGGTHLQPSVAPDGERSFVLELTCERPVLALFRSTPEFVPFNTFSLDAAERVDVFGAYNHVADASLSAAFANPVVEAVAGPGRVDCWDVEGRLDLDLAGTAASWDLVLPDDFDLFTAQGGAGDASLRLDRTARANGDCPDKAAEHMTAPPFFGWLVGWPALEPLEQGRPPLDAGEGGGRALIDLG